MKTISAAIAFAIAAFSFSAHADPAFSAGSKLSSAAQKEKEYVATIIPQVGVYGAFPGSPLEKAIRAGLPADAKQAMMAVSSALATASPGQGFYTVADGRTYIALATYALDPAGKCLAVTWLSHRKVVDPAQFPAAFSSAEAKPNLLAKAYSEIYGGDPLHAQNVICRAGGGLVHVYMFEGALDAEAWELEGRKLSADLREWTGFGSYTAAGTPGVQSFTFTPRIPSTGKLH